MKKKIETIAFGSVKAYAKVQARLMEFRAENPRALIETIPTIQPDGQVLFKARIVKDKADNTSAESSGHALGENKGVKAFEKLETIAVGRALALLGYASDGEIASSEEMEEYEEYQQEKKQELILSMTEKLDGVKSLEELKTAWAEVPAEVKKDLEAKKDEMKAILTSVAKEAV